MGLSLLVALVVGYRTLSAQVLIPGHGAPGIINVQDYGVRCDGSTDDRLAIAAAVAALPAAGGIVQFPPGTCQVTSSSPILSISSSRHSVWIRGAGAGATTLRQNGAGDGLSLTGAEHASVKISDLTLEGTNRGAQAIDINNAKDSTLEHITINGWLNHGINIRGSSNYMNVVRRAKITAGVGALTSGRSVNIRAGNGNRVEFTYFNSGATNRYDTALDVRGCAGCASQSNWFDSVPTAIRSNGHFSSIDDYFDMSSITAAISHRTNNTIMVIRPGGITDIAQFDFAGADPQYLTLLGLNGLLTRVGGPSVEVGPVDFRSATFATLGMPSNGRMIYCSDCTIANPCAGGGTGAFAKRLNGIWVCN